MVESSLAMSIPRRVLCLITDGFEEIETVTPVDILRRANVEVVISSMSGAREVTGRSGIRLVADEVYSGAAPEDFDVLLLPGGPAVAALRKDGRAAALARQFYDAGREVAAICAAPLILHDAGLLHGLAHTSHFSTHGELTAASGAERVVCSGRIVTSRGAGTALDFALELVRRLVSDQEAECIARAIMA